ncbi:MAG: pyridoxal phosphate-dependent aminotransferase [Kofleriaceae bacterium]|nr:pyridoxal phosphate-dependent aminotransferase [Myxococcales bacterium]MCB9562743.1 pyridoxal phosphate-dependent aminotransferase [Kofleriaceae bacterium]MCB9571065.1 pyridoxal phosphate-dependent aminotransferase [Kofleriaceae bacterium]
MSSSREPGRSTPASATPVGPAVELPPAPSISAFREVPRTGVIFVTTEARRRGFDPGADDWCNLGQGMPEADALPGAPPRQHAVTIDPGDQEYAPVPGLWELRETIASLYNQLFRRGLPSQYTAENVAVSGGGRTALTRVAASLGHLNLGHFLPDYTAYEELLDVFRLFSPIPILLEGERGYAFSAADLRREIQGRGLGAVLVSNPSNPTGKVIGGEELEGWVAAARDLDCALILDEFYSHYVWRPDLAAQGGISTAARYVEDVDRDPVVILDGLTKNWRYPGWRVTWTVGPRKVIDAVASAGSFLDGGGSRPLQRAAIPLLEPEATLAETRAIHAEFGKKRARLLNGLRDLGFSVDLPPEGTFYVWASAQHLPPSINDGMSFFRAALDRKVIAVPGDFFDVDPGKRRGGRYSRFRRHLRFSFGPTMDKVELALERIRALIDDAARQA